MHSVSAVDPIFWEWKIDKNQQILFFSAYHGHLTSLIDISHYKFSLPGGTGQKDHVHLVRTSREHIES